jgi:cell division protein FtsB
MKSRGRIKSFLWIVFVACVFGYFIYHAIEGERGWVEQKRLEREVSTAQEKLDKLRNEREQLEHRVKLMRSDSIDPDLLDEVSRKNLNLTKPNEIVVLDSQQKPGAAK